MVHTVISNKEKVLTVSEAAKILNVSRLTIKNYIYQGKLESFKTPGGHHRILVSDLNVIMKKPKTSPDYIPFIDSLISALEVRDTTAQGHSQRVAQFAQLIANHLNFSQEQLNNLKIAALLHDVGKLCIDQSILKKTEKLTEEEYQILKTHPLMAERILGSVEEFGDIIPLIKHHHERYDGQGYPYRLAKDDIPLEARIIAVAETYDSMTSDSSFRKKVTKKNAIKELEQQRGKQFDSKIIDVFVKALN